MAEEREFLTIEDVCELLQMTPDAVRKSVHHDGMPCRKCGNRWMFSRQGLHAWLSTGNYSSEKARRAAMRGDADADREDE